LSTDHAKPFHNPHTAIIQLTANANSNSGGVISGQVTDEDGVGIKGVGVTAYSTSDDGIFGSLTDENGQYKIESIPDGNYHIYFWGENWAYNDGYLSEWYQDKSNMAASDVITIENSSEILAINATLTEGGTLSGTVIDAQGVGIYKATLKMVDESGEIVFSHTDENGGYRFAGLANGDYQIFCDARSLGYLGQWYDGQSSQSSSTPITVLATSPVSGIDFSLNAGGGISGTVRNSVGKGIEEIYVKVFGITTGATGIGMTDTTGDYMIIGLPDDSYRVQFQGESKGYLDQWYNAQPSWDVSTLVAVDDEKQLSEIDCVLTLVDDGNSPAADNNGSSGGGGGCIISILNH
jgi:hypothetical protein